MQKDCYNVMVAWNYVDVLNVLELKMIVNNLINWFIITSLGGIGYIVWTGYKTKNEKRKLKIILYPEINDIQNELKTLSNCRNKAYNEYDSISEKDRLPQELNFYINTYSNVGDKLKLLNPECQVMLSQYYNKIGTIKEQYEKLKTVHGNLPSCLTSLELRDLRSSLKTTTILDSVLEFLESTEEAYSLGEKLIHDLKE